MTKITTTYETNSDKSRIYWAVEAEGETLGVYHANRYATFHGHDSSSGNARQVHGWASSPLTDQRGPRASLLRQAKQIAHNAGYDDAEFSVRRGSVI